MISVRIRFKLTDTLGNVSILDCDSDDWGIMHYRLSGRGGTPYALSNLGCKRDFPATTDDYHAAKELVPEIIRTIESGTKCVNEIVFAKTKGKHDHD